MSKRNNISYIKPQDPSFLAKLKAQIGYKEGPTVETKRQKLEADFDEFSSGDDERPDREDEKPQIVVLESGDLSAEQVAAEKERIARDEAEKPADLNKPIVFKKRQSKKSDTVEEADKEKHKKSKSSKKKSKATASSSKLSFNEDEEDEAAE